MGKYARLLVYILVAALGAMIIFFQVFPEFESSAKSIILIVVGAILLVDGVRSFIRYIRNM